MDSLKKWIPIAVTLFIAIAPPVIIKFTTLPVLSVAAGNNCTINEHQGTVRVLNPHIDFEINVEIATRFGLIGKVELTIITENSLVVRYKLPDENGWKFPAPSAKYARIELLRAGIVTVKFTTYGVLGNVKIEARFYDGFYWREYIVKGYRITYW
jgi:hypothetical protein